MHEAWAHQLEAWHDFYLLIGTAGVTLTGLLFVVVSLGPRVVANHEATGVRAFISPNAVYFTTKWPRNRCEASLRDSDRRLSRPPKPWDYSVPRPCFVLTA